MQTYEDFAFAALQSIRGASFGAVDADLMRAKFDRLDMAIKQLQVDMNVARALNQIDMTTDLNYTYFRQSWLQFYVDNYPSDIWWVSDELWQQTEAYEMDYDKWRDIYVQRTGTKPAPHTPPGDVPPPPKGTSPTFPGIPDPTAGISTTQLAIGLAAGIGVMVLLTHPSSPLQRSAR
jgi:hypothetical protein